MKKLSNASEDTRYSLSTDSVEATWQQWWNTQWPRCHFAICCRVYTSTV